MAFAFRIPFSALVGVVLLGQPAVGQNTLPATPRQTDDRPQVVLKELSLSQHSWDAGNMNLPAGARLHLERVRETKTPTGATAVTYHATATGIAHNKAWSILFWTIDGPPYTKFPDISLDDQGNVQLHVGSNAASTAPGGNRPLDLTFLAAPGEPIRLALVSDDGQVRLTTTVVPWPLETSSGNCRLTALLGNHNADLVMISGDGFAPNASVEVDGSSGGQPRHLTATADTSGHFATAMLPPAPGHSSGTLSLTAKTAACAPHIDVPWGTGSYKSR